MNIKNAINIAYVKLNKAHCESPKIKARLLMQFVLKKPYSYLVIYDNEELSTTNEEMFFSLVEKVRKGTPIEHITHQKEFMKLNFYVDENVLIPRQETEIIVEQVIKLAKQIKEPKVLDLCTGSGAIAISIKKYVDKSEVTAIDISKKALDVAKKNARLNDVNICFIESNLFSKVSFAKADEILKYDIIVSNPPYIKRDVLLHLPKDVRSEPKLALDGGYDGLTFYKQIIPEAKQYLKKGGYLVFEIGYDQANDVKALFEKENCFEDIEVIKDYSNKDRCVKGKLI